MRKTTKKILKFIVLVTILSVIYLQITNINHVEINRFNNEKGAYNKYIKDHKNKRHEISKCLYKVDSDIKSKFIF